MADINEKCGICAAYTFGRNSAHDLYQMMLDLQHRGQAGAGISTYNPERKIIIRTHKGQGRVPEVFGGTNDSDFRSIIEKFKGPLGIGHTRYGTSGGMSSRHVQPFERVHGVKYKWFTFGFNGHIANRRVLEEKIRGMGYHLMLDTDTELIMHLLSRHISDTGGEDLSEVFKRISEEFDGAFNIVFLDAEGNLIAMRDPRGFRPLATVQTDTGSYAASESSALFRMGTYHITHVKPGEMAILTENGIEYERFTEPKRKSLCFFEYLYFASVNSEIDGIPVYEARKRCGEELAKLETENINGDDWVIIPVPNTSRPFANSYAKSLGFPDIYDEGLIASGKGRTFIEEVDRSQKVKTKFLPIPSILRNKKVIVIDDSIVRSTTMKTLISYHLKKIAGAKEVHVRIATPPIVAPCYYGIDMKSFEELFAAKYFDKMENGRLPDGVLEEMARYLKADSLIYMTHQSLLKALGLERSEICMACLDRKYPTPYAKETNRESYSKWEKECTGCPGKG